MSGTAFSTWSDGFAQGLGRFEIDGIVRCAPAFFTPRGGVVGPQSDQALAIIDDPYAIQPDGSRLAGTQCPDYGGRFPGLRDSGDQTDVHLWEGAELRLPALDLPKGCTVYFEYCFVRGKNPDGGGPELDLAIFLRRPASGKQQATVLCDTGMLRTQDQEHSGWRSHTVRFQRGFRGSLSWICVNGAIANAFAGAPSPIGPLYPSALLLDCVKVL